MRHFTPKDINYRTTPGPVSFWARALPELVCYTKFLRTVFKASAKAKKGCYHDTQWYNSSLEVLKTLESIGVCFEINGVEHLQQLSGPCVIVANHMSVLETVIMPFLILPFKNFTFIVKDSLMAYPVFKHVLRTRHPIVVNRVNPRQDLKTVMTEGTRRLENGISVVVFPQTTRSTSFDPDKFNSMGVKLAARAKVPVLPLALATDAWNNGKIVKEFGKIDTSKTVRFSFGNALPINGRGRDQHQAIIDFIGKQLDQWH